MLSEEFYWTIDPLKACSFADRRVAQRVALGMQNKGPEDIKDGLAWEGWEWMDISGVGFGKFAFATYWYSENEVRACYIARFDGSFEDNRTC